MKRWSFTLLLASATAATCVGKPPETVGCIRLSDQYDRPHELCFPGTRPTVLLVADRKSATDVDAWLAPLKERFSGRIEIRGVAQVAGVPSALRPRVRRRFQQDRDHPVLMDWSGETCSQLSYDGGALHLIVLNTNGLVVDRLTGPASGNKLQRAFDRIDSLLAPVARTTD